MQRYLRERIDWPQAFPGEEYAHRRAKLREALGANGIDGIYVSIPADLTFLTGYDMIWYHLRNLTGLFVQGERDDTLFCDARARSVLRVGRLDRGVEGAGGGLDAVDRLALAPLGCRAQAVLGMGAQEGVEPGRVRRRVAAADQVDALVQDRVLESVGAARLAVTKPDHPVGEGEHGCRAAPWPPAC